MAGTDWTKALNPLIEKYKGKAHPLEYKNLYQMVVMVVLSAQTTDKLINDIAPQLFRVFPDLKSLSLATEEELHRQISKVRNFRQKGRWLIEIAKKAGQEKNIPLTIDELIKLPGIGRKSANVIMRGAGVKAEGVIVDLHVIRVAGRLGISGSEDPVKIEKDIMAVTPQKDWGEAGMAISFLGREICRPSNPEHSLCIMKNHCAYYLKLSGGVKKKKTASGKTRKRSQL